MRLIGLESNGAARVEFYGCNLICPYCVHIKQDKFNKSVDEVAEFIEDSGARDVYLGGAEPTIQRKELLELIDRLEGKRITLKTSGMKPDVVEEILDRVDRFVVEVKAPLDDVEANAELAGLSEERGALYVENLRRTLELAKQKRLRVWIRVIPRYVNRETMPRILEDVRGADELMLYQFLSNPEFDEPALGYEEPVPTGEEMRELAETARQVVPKVIIQD